MAILDPNQRRNLPPPGVEELIKGRRSRLFFKEFKRKAKYQEIPESDVLDLYKEYLQWHSSHGGMLGKHYT